ncbi:hypothetical protein JW319_10835 [Enterobacter cloacae subsp. cloacae]|uniref:hypothetical protein n=1 Tax=Enterobacter cloacae TaxID=550 RepID=UPI001C5B1477|nr:hypothetical protein [Enterobacter cloacae]MBW4201869.1 hypothetical protein [Enterobacter cloacae subsp. cloacae]
MALKSPPAINISKIRWTIISCYEQTGVLPFILSAIVLFLSIYWAISLRPGVNDLESGLTKIQRSFSIPLPGVKATANHSQQAISTTEYQQLKTLFAVLKKNSLQVNESHYQTSSDRGETLILDIPLSGDYPHLYQSLQEIKALLPVTIEAITLSRERPDSTALNILLRITLKSAKS